MDFCVIGSVIAYLPICEGCATIFEQQRENNFLRYTTHLPLGWCFSLGGYELVTRQTEKRR